MAVVAFNNASTIHDALSSTATTCPELETELIVWDNGSTDGTAEICQGLEGCELIHSSENIGFSAAANRLLERARGSYVLFLNPDCVMQSGTLSLLVCALASNHQLGAVSPYVHGVLRGRRHAGGGWQPSLPRLAVEVLALPSLMPRWAGPRGIWARASSVTATEELHSVDWASGACLLVRRDVMRDIGGFDERWFMYAEDMDLGRRMAASGWGSAITPNARVDHLGGVSHGTDGSTWSLQARSLIDYFDTKVGRESALDRLLFRLLLLGYLAARWMAIRPDRTRTGALMKSSWRTGEGRLPSGPGQAKRVGWLSRASWRRSPAR